MYSDSLLALRFNFALNLPDHLALERLIHPVRKMDAFLTKGAFHC